MIRTDMRNNNRRTRMAMRLAAVLLALKGAHATGAEQDEIVTRLREQIVTQRQRVQSMIVTYRAQLTCDASVKESGRLAGRAVEQTETVAFKGRKRYARSEASALDDSSRPYKSERVSVYTGVDQRRRESKALQIQRDKSAYSELNLYANALLWPTTDAELQSCTVNPASAHFLPHFLDDPSWHTVPGRHVIGSTECIKLSTGSASRQLWLDPERGFAIIRYQHDRPVEGEHRWLFDYEDFTRIDDSLFLPRRIVSRHDMADLKTDEPVGTMTNTIQVTDLKVNDVPESLFVLNPLPGELVIDNTRRTIYRFHPVTDTTLDQSIEQATGATLRTPNTSLYWRLFVVINICVAVTIGAFWLARRLRPAA